MSARIRNRLWRIVAGLILFVAAFVTFRLVDGAPWYAEFFAYAAIYLLVAYDVLWKAVRNISHGQVFDENFLMVIATVGAFCVREYPEAAAVMLFYQVGELFQSLAVGKSRRSISALMDIRPDSATLLRDGKRITVSPEEVAPGDVIEVRAGEKIPLDGVVLRGAGVLDTAALTGESLPLDVREGDAVLSGAISSTSVLEITVTKPFAESTAAKILDLVENASSKKAKAENFITKFAKFYTPAVVGLAVLLAIVPSLITRDWAEWVHRALMFLVVSCPCALVISVPLAFFGGLGAASTRGVLVKGGNYLELLAKTSVIAFDKTGTLTEGKFAVTDISPHDRRREILAAAAVAEWGSNHPVARAVLAAAECEDLAPRDDTADARKEWAGKGVEASCGGDTVWAGNAALMESIGVSVPPCETCGTVVHVAKNGVYLGAVTVADRIKDNAADVIADFRRKGVRTVMLTGDNARAAAAMAEAAGVTEYAAGLLPADKVAHIESLLEEKKGVVAFVGDGINDAPVLSRADVGIAMGALGSDAAIEAADVVLMHDNLGAIAEAKEVAKKTLAVATENIVFSLLVKAAVLVLSALGLSSMWLAIFADVGVTVLAVCNAARMIAYGRKANENTKKRGKKEKKIGKSD